MMATAAVATVLIVGSPAWAGPTGDPPPTQGDDLAAVQMRLIASADRISAVAHDAAGWTGISVRAELGELWVYWNGELPATVRRAVDAERQRVAVMVVPARYSERTLLAAAERIVRQPGVTAVAPSPTGDALAVSVAGDEEFGRSLPAVRSASVDILIEPFEHPVLAAGRQHDTSPYRGGAMYHWPLGGGYIGLCTTGFAVKVGVVKKIASAGHCGEDGNTVYAGNGSGATPVMGTLSGKDKTHDTLLIEASSTGSVYYGPYTATTSKTIHAVIGIYKDTLVCTSGSMTGQHCKIRIKYTNKTIVVADDDGGTYLITEMVQGDQDDKTVAVGQGDSGGPVVAQDSWNPITGAGSFALVYPQGTISAQDDGPGKVVACASQYPTTCSWRVYFADINKTLTRYGATIVM